MGPNSARYIEIYVNTSYHTSKYDQPWEVCYWLKASCAHSLFIVRFRLLPPPPPPSLSLVRIAAKCSLSLTVAALNNKQNGGRGERGRGGGEGLVMLTELKLGGN